MRQLETALHNLDDSPAIGAHDETDTAAHPGRPIADELIDQLDAAMDDLDTANANLDAEAQRRSDTITARLDRLQHPAIDPPEPEAPGRGAALEM